jgi:hypothetical protein
MAASRFNVFHHHSGAHTALRRQGTWSAGPSVQFLFFLDYEYEIQFCSLPLAGTHCYIHRFMIDFSQGKPLNMLAIQVLETDFLGGAAILLGKETISLAELSKCAESAHPAGVAFMLYPRDDGQPLQLTLSVTRVKPKFTLAKAADSQDLDMLNVLLAGQRRGEHLKVLDIPQDVPQEELDVASLTPALACAWCIRCNSRSFNKRRLRQGDDNAMIIAFRRLQVRVADRTVVTLHKKKNGTPWYVSSGVGACCGALVVDAGAYIINIGSTTCRFVRHDGCVR